jgi:hypothetical protein
MRDRTLPRKRATGLIHRPDADPTFALVGRMGVYVCEVIGMGTPRFGYTLATFGPDHGTIWEYEDSSEFFSETEAFLAGAIHATELQLQEEE